MVESPRYRGLLLDFGGALTTNFFAAFEPYCIRQGLRPTAVFDLMTSDPDGTELWHKVERGEINQTKFEKGLAALLDVPAEGLIIALLEDLRPDGQMIAATATARGAGIRVAIISHSWGSEPYDPCSPWDLPSLADAVLISHELGVRKPDPAIFLVRAERIGVKPSECVFVDEIADNLSGAKDVGMATVHHQETMQTIQDLERLFDLPLRSQVETRKQHD